MSDPPSASTSCRTASRSARRGSGSSSRSRCRSASSALPSSALVHGVLVAQIDNQKSRNTLLKDEIAKLDEQIKEIDKLRDQIQQVLARKQVVETLQANRSEAVHLLDQLVRQLPDGIYLESVKQIGHARCTMVGYAQSQRARVHAHAQHRGLALDREARAGRDQAVPAPGAQSEGRRAPKINEFTLNFQVKRAAPPTDVRAVGAGAAKGAPAKAAPAAAPSGAKA